MVVRSNGADRKTCSTNKKKIKWVDILPQNYIIFFIIISAFDELDSGEVVRAKEK